MSKPIVVWRLVGGRESIHTELVLAEALKNRGHKTRFVVCDKVLSGCIQGGNVGVNRDRCQGCWTQAQRLCSGVDYITLSNLVPRGRQRKLHSLANNLPYKDIPDMLFHKTPVGRFAIGSMIRHLKGAPLEAADKVTRLQRHLQLREFLYSSLVCLDAARVYYHKYRPTKSLMQTHIEYVGWGPAYYYFAARKDMDAITWSGSLDNTKHITMKYRRGADFSAQHLIPEETWEVYREIQLTKSQNKSLDKRLELSGISKEELLAQLRISDDKPIWCTFPHMTWDVGLNPTQWPFENVEDWVLTTVKAMLETPGVTWLLKAHPAERHATAKGVIEIIRENFPGVDKQITFLGPRTKIRATDLSLVLSGGVTLQGSVAIELPTFGVPIIAGNPSYPGKEFTYNKQTRREYIDLIHSVTEIDLLSSELKDRARRYAYYAYFRRKLKLKATKSGKGYSPIVHRKMLLPGKDKTMDMICNRIIHGGEFIC